MNTFNELYDADEFGQLIDNTEAEINQHSLSLEDCVAAFSVLGKGVSRKEAQLVADIGCLDTDETPVESFTMAPSGINESVLMLGLASGLADAIAAIARAIWKILKALVRAILFPFKWVYGLFSSEATGGGGGGSLSPKMESVKRELERGEKAIEDLCNEMGIDHTKLEPSIENYLGQLAEDVIDSSAIGSFQNYVGAISKAANTLPIGIYEALINKNAVLWEMGIFSHDPRREDLTGLWKTRFAMTNLGLVKEETSGYIARRLFDIDNAVMFTDVVTEGNERKMTGFRGTKLDLRKLYAKLVMSPFVSDKSEPDSTKWSEGARLQPTMELLKTTRYHAFHNLLILALEDTDAPVFHEVLEAFNKVDMADMTGSLSSIMDKAFDIYKNAPIWERVKEANDSLTRTMADEGKAHELDVIKHLNDPTSRQNINELWTTLDSYVAQQGNEGSYVRKRDDEPATAPSQVGDLDVILSGPMKSETIHRPLGVAYTLVSAKVRKEYNIDDARLERTYNKVIPGGDVSEADESVRTAYTIKTLEAISREARGKFWTEEADAFKALAALIKDNVNMNSRVVKFASLTQFYFNTLITAAWSGLNKWMTNVQYAYIALISYSVIKAQDPERHIKEIEYIIGKKLTDEERQLAIEDFHRTEPSTPVMPIAAMSIIGKHLESDEVTQDRINQILQMTIKFTNHSQRGHQQRLRLFNKYMATNRHSKTNKPVDLTMEEINRILRDEGLEGMRRSAKRNHADSLQFTPFKAEWSKKPKVPELLKEWIKTPGEPFPDITGVVDIDENMRKNYAHLGHAYWLRVKLKYLKDELARDEESTEMRDELNMMIKTIEQELSDMPGNRGRRRR